MATCGGGDLFPTQLSAPLLIFLISLLPFTSLPSLPPASELVHCCCKLGLAPPGC